MVKKTVNFDDPASYHLYYGDHAGSPGTLVTYFTWPGARLGRPGAGSITRLGLSTPAGEVTDDPAGQWADDGGSGMAGGQRQHN